MANILVSQLMVRIIFLAGILSAFSFGVCAQNLLPEALAVQSAYKAYKKEPSLPENQLNFLSLFPASKSAFINVFDPNTFGQLHSISLSYIGVFNDLGRMYPRKALPKAITISKELHGADGSVRAMQLATLQIANSRPAIFLDSVRVLKKNELPQLIQFLSTGDEEIANEYARLVTNMKNIKYDKLVQQFEHRLKREEHAEK